MYRRKDFLGVPVVDAATGRTLGRVQELVVDSAGGRVLGFLVATGASVAFLGWEDVTELGLGAVMVSRVDRPLQGVRTRSASRPGAGRLVGKPILTPDGRDLGVVEDLHFDPTGAVLAWEVSGGIVHDLLEGRNVMPAPAGAVLGDDAVLIAGGRGHAPAGPGANRARERRRRKGKGP